MTFELHLLRNGSMLPLQDSSLPPLVITGSLCWQRAGWHDWEWVNVGLLSAIEYLYANPKLEPIPMAVTALHVLSLVHRVRAGLNTSHPLKQVPLGRAYAQPPQRPWEWSIPKCVFHSAILPIPLIALSSTKPLPWPLKPNPGWNCILSIPCPMGTSLYSSGYKAEVQ